MFSRIFRWPALLLVVVGQAIAGPSQVVQDETTQNIDSAKARLSPESSAPLAVQARIAKAEAGNSNAMLEIGSLYLYGKEQVPRNSERAAYWFQKAAARGDRNGKDYLARMYLAGFGVEKNYQEAYRLFSELAQSGSTAAASKLGVMYKDGLGTPQDFAKALYWIRKSVGGVGGELFPLAQMYAEGTGVERNQILALALARYSADSLPTAYQLDLEEIGDNPAIALADQLKLILNPHDVAVSSDLNHQLVTAYLNGNLLAEIDIAAAKRSNDYEKSAAKVASHFLSQYSEDQNVPLALILLEPLLKSGDSSAQYLMGKFYAEGTNVARDMDKANRYFSMAEMQGNVDALTRKAGMYDRGDGVKQNSPMAFSLYEMAAKGGGAWAQVRVADMLFDGNGVERNLKQSKTWYLLALDNPTAGFSRANARYGLARINFDENNATDAVLNLKIAAATGNKTAQLHLAKLYFNASGVPRNLPLAYALSRVVLRNEPANAEAKALELEAQKQLPSEERVATEILTVTLFNSDGVSNFVKRESDVFLKAVNDSEASKKQ